MVEWRVLPREAQAAQVVESEDVEVAKNLAVGMVHIVHSEERNRDTADQMEIGAGKTGYASSGHREGKFRWKRLVM